MTATQLYVRMQQLLNFEFNDELLTATAAQFLTKAQRAILDAAYYNRKEKVVVPTPTSSFQSDHYGSELLAPLEIEDATLTNQSDGFVAYPSDLLHLTAVWVRIGKECEGSDDLIPVRETSDNELATRNLNKQLKPVWENQKYSPLYWYRPAYTFLTKQGVTGIRLYPHHENGHAVNYKVTVRYLKVPVDIKIQSTPYEIQAYGNQGLQNFQVQGQDINPSLPDFIHEELAELACKFFYESVDDLQQAQVKTATIQSGIV
jgi:hypothetical protein